MGSEDEAEQSLGRPSRQATAGPSGHAEKCVWCQQLPYGRRPLSHLPGSGASAAANDRGRQLKRPRRIISKPPTAISCADRQPGCVFNTSRAGELNLENRFFASGPSVMRVFCWIDPQSARLQQLALLLKFFASTRSNSTTDYRYNFGIRVSMRGHLEVGGKLDA